MSEFTKFKLEKWAMVTELQKGKKWNNWFYGYKKLEIPPK